MKNKHETPYEILSEEERWNRIQKEWNSIVNGSGYGILTLLPPKEKKKFSMKLFLLIWCLVLYAMAIVLVTMAIRINNVLLIITGILQIFVTSTQGYFYGWRRDEQ